MEKDNFPIIDGSCPTCPGKIEVPTAKEREALAALKSIKERVRKLKGNLAELEVSDRDQDRKNTGKIREELVRLKEVWDKWEEKRQHAAKERMILLGHEESS